MSSGLHDLRVQLAIGLLESNGNLVEKRKILKALCDVDGVVRMVLKVYGVET